MSTFSSLKPFLWWKRYLTQLQLTQFVLIILHSMYSMMIPSCGWPREFMYLSILNAFIFFYLFYTFFRNTYKNAAASKAAAAAAAAARQQSAIGTESTSAESNGSAIHQTKSPDAEQKKVD